jgi:hypothetical protein
MSHPLFGTTEQGDAVHRKPRRRYHQQLRLLPTTEVTIRLIADVFYEQQFVTQELLE